MKKILLTGATGFIGRHCLPVLVSKGYEVYAVSSKKIPEGSAKAIWHQADLLDHKQVTGLIASIQPELLLHLAWYAEPGKYWTSIKNVQWVEASLHLLNAFHQNGGKRVVIAGTSAEYDWQFGYCKEGITPTAPATPYGVSKHALQIMLEVFAQQTQISAAWGRIFYLYGPHEYPSRLMAAVICSLLRAEPAQTTHGNQIRDYLYVQDVADAIVALLESDISGPVNIGSGQPIKLKDIIYKIANKIDRIDLVQLGAIQPPFNEPNLLVADVDRLVNQVGWSPHYDLDSGLDKTIEWWKEKLAS